MVQRPGDIGAKFVCCGDFCDVDTDKNIYIYDVCRYSSYSGKLLGRHVFC